MADMDQRAKQRLRLWLKSEQAMGLSAVPVRLAIGEEEHPIPPKAAALGSQPPSTPRPPSFRPAPQRQPLLYVSSTDEDRAAGQEPLMAPSPDLPFLNTPLLSREDRISAL